MQVIFESRDQNGAELRELAVRRVNFVMRRLAWLVPRAKVRLWDVNGPRGGVDKCCRLEFKTDHVGTVTITSVARDWRSALESALQRAAQRLLRSWQRRRDHKRSRHLAFDFDQ
ncbi:MAG: HPF/RaiA family ribosome-associated protein [Betaproteobacteria bacterium]